MSSDPCEGFQWVGQSFASCDKCGKPYWEHDYDMQAVDGPFHPLTPVPIPDDLKQRVRAKWGSQP